MIVCFYCENNTKPTDGKAYIQCNNPFKFTVQILSFQIQQQSLIMWWSILLLDEWNFKKKKNNELSRRIIHNLHNHHYISNKQPPSDYRDMKDNTGLSFVKEKIGIETKLTHTLKRTHVVVQHIINFYTWNYSEM